MRQVTRSRRFLFYLILWTLVGGSCFAVYKVANRLLWYVGPHGPALNRLAWEATYTERGLTPPPDGPREGYGGSRLGKKASDQVVGWHERPIALKDLLNINAEGVQYTKDKGPQARRLLILGGSVAFGAYASREELTYYARLAEILDEQGAPVNITVVASGGWTSRQELAALEKHLDRLRPEAVLFLNGLNDLTQQKEKTEDERVNMYLHRMLKAYFLCRARGVRTAYALQPFLPGKTQKTLWEKRIMKFSYDPALLARCYPRLRAGLAGLGRREGALFMDVSGLFDGETASTFADIWHFSDPAHALLAERLAEALGPWLSQSASKNAILKKARI